MSTAIEFNNVGKMYRLGRVGTGTLSHDLNRFWQTKILRREDPYLKIGQINDRTTKGDSDYVWALRDINFKVEEGEVLGIIGKNGAGKSTLLKLLSNITSPTIGEITAYGRIASLLEVGTGFHSEMTGRENIYMNGSIMGMTHSEINRKLDEIVDFAGVDRYLDTPVKRYSSGMTVRLGFAVAAFLEPEILVVDEVLTVGDAEFQKKALGKMNDVAKGDGRTVLFVSHNMAAVRNLCTRGVVLQNGQLVFDGKTNDAVDYYVGTNINNLLAECDVTEECRKSYFARDVELVHVKMLNNAAEIASDEDLQFELTLKVNEKSRKETQYCVNIFDSSDQRVSGFYSNPIRIPQDKDVFKVLITLKHHDLFAGRYMVQFIVGQRDFSNAIRNYDATKPLLAFEVKYVREKTKEEFSINETWLKGINHNGDLISVSVV